MTAPAGSSSSGVALHVCTRYQRGGSERRIRDLVRALPELRHHLVLGRDSDVQLAREQTGAERVWVLPALVRQVAPLHDAVVLLQLWRRLRAARYDVLVTHQSKAGVLGRVAALLAGGPAVVHSLSMASFGPGYGRLENLVFTRVERSLGRRTAAFCVVGTELADRFASVGVAADRLHVVRSGIPLPLVLPSRKQARSAVAARHGVPGGRPLLCYVGSLEPRKNVLLLLDVLVALRRRLPDCPVLLVVGDGPQRADLERRVRQLGLDADVVLTGHLSDPAHVGEALRAADVVLLLSSAEGLPQVLVQAAGAATPFVAFDVEGVREILALGAAGSVAPLGDLAAVVRAVEHHLVGEGGPQPTADLSSWSADAIRTAYRSVVRSVLGGP